MQNAIRVAVSPRALMLAVAAAVCATTLVVGQSHRPFPRSSGPLAAPAQSRAPLSARVDFEHQVKPLLAEKCLECHSAEKRKGGLSLATYGDLLDGGRDGAVLRPGNSGGSLLVHRITGRVEPQMPKDEAPLGPGQIALIRLWIDQGARETPASPPAPPPWEPPLALTRPALPAVTWPAWRSPLDRLVSRYLSDRGRSEPELVSDALFARRAYLDVWGLLPPPPDLQAFVADRRPDKRAQLVAALAADSEKYAGHWMSFWNDLLRNEDGVTYFSETGGRKSITSWLFASLQSNLPYDRFVSKLIDPAAPGDPDGFLVGVNWRGETSAAVTPWMQASQNTAQVFLGVNLKCNSCHDSFISRWKLRDAYGLAGFFSPDPKLRLYRCDVALDQYAAPRFLYPEVSRVPASMALADRRAAAAATFTDPRNGRLARTIVNRIWLRLLGHGIVANPDEMDGKPWSPEVLDWLAADFVAHGYDLKRLIATIVASRAYQMPAVPRRAEPPARDYVFAGPEVRRLTAEQFADAVGAITGEWSVYQPAGRRSSPPPGSDPQTSGAYGREWRAASTNLTRALGRPVRDQIISVRGALATTPQALELVNGEILTRRLEVGARRLAGDSTAEPLSLFNKSVAGRNASPGDFDIDVSKASRLWLIVQDVGSNAPERVLPVWAQADLVGPEGVTPLSRLKPIDESGVRGAASSSLVPVMNPSTLVYDIPGRGFTRFRGSVAIQNAKSDIGSTLNPAVRFFVFDAPPDMGRLLPPAGGTPLPAPAPLRTPGEIVDRVFWYALGRAPSSAERQAAEAAVADPAHAGRVSAAGIADLLWAVLMKPEFQLIY